MFLAIDCVAQFTHVALFYAATKQNGAASLEEVVTAYPYTIHTALHGQRRGVHRAATASKRPDQSVWWAHFRPCLPGIMHKLTKPYHPWANGQVERMNRAVKEATIKSFLYPDFDALKAHVQAFVTAYNFAKHLKSLRWRTPFKTICDA